MLAQVPRRRKLGKLGVVWEVHASSACIWGKGKMEMYASGDDGQCWYGKHHEKNPG